MGTWLCRQSTACIVMLIYAPCLDVHRTETHRHTDADFIIISIGIGFVFWHQRADEKHGNPPQGNQELLVVRDKVGRPPGELGVSMSMECDIFPFSALTLLVG